MSCDVATLVKDSVLLKSSFANKVAQLKQSE
jgi:hypothetical protein